MPLAKIVKEKIKPKHELKAWEVILIILGSPVWIPLLITAAVLFINTLDSSIYTACVILCGRAQFCSGRDMRNSECNPTVHSPLPICSFSHAWSSAYRYRNCDTFHCVGKTCYSGHIQGVQGQCERYQENVCKGEIGYEQDKESGYSGIGYDSCRNNNYNICICGKWFQLAECADQSQGYEVREYTI